LDYNNQGGLIILRRPGHTNIERAAERVTRVLKDGIVLADDGTELTIDFDSICVHSDTPNATEIAGVVRSIVNA
jgi:UPF0271 protein